MMIDINILVYFHCSVDSQKIENGYILRDCQYKLEDLEQYDLTFLGDTITINFWENEKIAFPNSLIQQNFGESVDNHGFIK